MNRIKNGPNDLNKYKIFLVYIQHLKSLERRVKTLNQLLLNWLSVFCLLPGRSAGPAQRRSNPGREILKTEIYLNIYIPFNLVFNWVDYIFKWLNPTR